MVNYSAADPFTLPGHVAAVVGLSAAELIAGRDHAVRWDPDTIVESQHGNTSYSVVSAARELRPVMSREGRDDGRAAFRTRIAGRFARKLVTRNDSAINPHDVAGQHRISSSDGNDTFVFHADFASTDAVNSLSAVTSSGSLRWLFDVVASPPSMGAHDGQSDVGRNGGARSSSPAASSTFNRSWITFFSNCPRRSRILTSTRTSLTEPSLLLKGTEESTRLAK